MTQQPNAPISGMRAILWLWFGQLISLIGTGMTRFAMTVWVWQQTESATAVALLWVFLFGPGIFMSPIAGTLVDRWNRKRVMILSDVGAGAATIAVLLVYLSGSLEIWHLYLAGFVASTLEAFQSPAQTASVTTMVSKDNFARANGLMGMLQFGATVVSPALAGILIAPIGFDGVFGIDIATFLFAVGVLLFLRVPQPPPSTEAQGARGSFFREMAYGFRYIGERKSLLNLLLLFAVVNFLVAFFVGIINPLILARTGSEEILGLVLTMNGVGGVLGGLLLGAWGGPKTRIYGVLGGIVAMNLGLVIVGAAQSVVVWSVGAFVIAFFIPIINGCNIAIWQSKVAPDLQGRAFGVMRFVAQAVFPLSLVLVGPLADYVFEPAMQAGGGLVDLFGPVVGSGEGAGMALMMLLAGLAGVAVGIFGFLARSLRTAETQLPDHVPAGEPGT